MLTLLALPCLATWPLFPSGMKVGQETGAIFHPIISALEDHLAIGNISGWNPYQVVGVSFAPDPESAWRYLRVTFSSLPPLAWTCRQRERGRDRSRSH